MFPLTGLGVVLSYVTRIDPLAYGVDGMRNAFGSPNIAFSPSLDAAVLVIVGIVFLIFGAWRFTKIEA